MEIKDEHFNGKNNAEKLYFKSALEREDTIRSIENNFPTPYAYHANHEDGWLLKFTKRRLFFCEYNIHCDIYEFEKKCEINLYYTMNNINWTYWLFGILTIFIIGITGILAKGDDNINGLIFIGIEALVLWVVHGYFYSTPQEELYSACKRAKTELEGHIKLELES